MGLKCNLYYAKVMSGADIHKVCSKYKKFTIKIAKTKTYKISNYKPIEGRPLPNI